MSYILEALRRAEREREGGRPVGIESISDAMELARSQAPLRIWALGLMTLFVAFAALLVALLRQPAPIIITVPTPAPAVSVAPAAPSVAAAPAANALTIVTPNAAPDSPDANSEAGPTASNSGDFDDTGSPMAEPEPTDSGGSMRSSRRKTEKAASRSSRTRQRASNAAPAEADNSDAPDATRLQDMPDAYRAQFPSTTLDVHVYDSDASRRWIMVDGKRYHEGETLANGAHIKAIGADSVTYDYNGAQVAVPVH